MEASREGAHFYKTSVFREPTALCVLTVDAYLIQLVAMLFSVIKWRFYVKCIYVTVFFPAFKELLSAFHL